jgi:hypothetical protein
VVVAVGYDDRRLPGNQGAILIRSSWGTQWGQSGYGWLPYSFVTGPLQIQVRLERIEPVTSVPPRWHGGGRLPWGVESATNAGVIFRPSALYPIELSDT